MNITILHIFITTCYCLFLNIIALSVDAKCLRDTSPVVLLLSNISAEIGPRDWFTTGPDSAIHLKMFGLMVRSHLYFTLFSIHILLLSKCKSWALASFSDILIRKDLNRSFTWSSTWLIVMSVGNFQKWEKERRHPMWNTHRVFSFFQFMDTPGALSLSAVTRHLLLCFSLQETLSLFATINTAILTRLIYRFKPIPIRILAGLKKIMSWF